MNRHAHKQIEKIRSGFKNKIYYQGSVRNILRKHVTRRRTRAVRRIIWIKGCQALSLRLQIELLNVIKRNYFLGSNVHAPCARTIDTIVRMAIIWTKAFIRFTHTIRTRKNVLLHARKTLKRT